MRVIIIALALLAAAGPALAQEQPPPASAERDTPVIQPERPVDRPNAERIEQPDRGGGSTSQPAEAAPPSRDIIPQVVGGEDVEEGQAPWQAQILWAKLINNPDAPDAWQRKHQCGGAVIAPRWVLTAAHCFNIRDADFDPVVELRVRAGVLNIRTSDAPAHEIVRVVIHPDYHAPLSDTRPTPHDLALVELQSPLFLAEDGEVEPLPLAGDLGERALQGGDGATFTGWGQTSSAEGARPTELLQEGTLLLLSRRDCNDEHGAGVIGPGMICAFEHSSFGEITSICGGDSGGPLVTRIDGRRQLAGIASWIDQCGDTPSVFTSVRAHREWIRQTMAQP